MGSRDTGNGKGFIQLITSITLAAFIVTVSEGAPNVSVSSGLRNKGKYLPINPRAYAMEEVNFSSESE